MKKRIVTIALVIALLATCFGGTIAYLTDTKAVKNTFTIGNVYITLEETGAEEGENSYHLLPAIPVTKDPTITLNEGSEDAYVAAKITITGNLYDLIGVTGTDLIDINVVAKGGLIGDGTVAPVETTWNNLNVHKINGAYIYQDADKANNTWTLYIFMEVAQVAKTETVLFTTLTALPAWDNAEMEKINGMEINVEAFATQAAGFADCYQAMTEAFGGQFNFS